jgi:hypothetical protein
MEGCCRAEFLSLLIFFARQLKGNGLKITPYRVINAARSLEFIDLSRREDFSAALKASFVSGREDIAVFEELFKQFWGSWKKTRPVSPVTSPEGCGSEGDGGSKQNLSLSSMDFGPAPEEKGDEKKKQSGGYSPREVLMERDFRKFLLEEQVVLNREITCLLARIATRVSRRLEPAARGRKLDFRRCFRRSMNTGGELLKLIRRQYKVKPLRVIVICDVSGSMDASTRFTLQFIFGLQKIFRRSEFFVFSTRLTRVTDLLKRSRWAESLAAISHRVHDWSGGTKIGFCLQHFNERYASGLTTGSAVVVIFSDGWDRGDSGLLDREMKRLKRIVRQLIWVNPCLGTPGYQPLSQGMRTALPYIDHFFPASTLKGLQGLGDALVALSPK